MRVASRCLQLGLAPVFLTDHNSVDGALGLAATGRYPVVVGEEVMTQDGELIGLFLTEKVPNGFPAIETAAQIKSQGGLVYLEHPYDKNRRALAEETIESMARMIDIVEVFNGRSDPAANRKAEDLREVLGAAPCAGSDAHALAELGSVYVEMEEFDGAQDFLAKLRRGRIVTGKRQWLLAAQARLRPRIRQP